MAHPTFFFFNYASYSDFLPACISSILPSTTHYSPIPGRRSLCYPMDGDDGEDVYGDDSGKKQQDDDEREECLIAEEMPRSSSCCTLSGIIAFSGCFREWCNRQPEIGKRVMVVVDPSKEALHAINWALSHVVHRHDTLTLLCLMPKSTDTLQDSSNRSNEPWQSPTTTEPAFATALKTLCSSLKPEVEVHVVFVEGKDKGPTIVGQARKLEASILILGQRRPTLIQKIFKSKGFTSVDYCIQNAECLTLAVRRRGKRVGGYIISSKWQKNFWLLA